jgi:hypothetical protein
MASSIKISTNKENKPPVIKVAGKTFVIGKY